jgi:L-seryl-tRNA(Ser) seleniumtransferase
LAERAARYVVSRQQGSQRSVINATGRIIGGPWAGAPLADCALERMLSAGRGFVPSLAAADSTGGNTDELESLVCRLVGAPAALVVHNYAGALWLALAALAEEREVLISRAEVGEVDSAGPLPKLAAAARVVLRDVGTAHRTQAADYEAAASPRAAALLKFTSDSYQIVGEIAAAELEELVAVARDRDLVLIDALGAAPLVDPPEAVAWPRRSVRGSLASGVDLVIVRGDGLIGGPACGILAGNAEVIGRIAVHPLCAAWRLDPLRAAGLIGTLQCHDAMAKTDQLLPVWQLLTTPVDNLRNRAERLAPQIAAAEGIASAEPIETRSPVSAAFSAGEHWPSYGIAIGPNGGTLAELQHRLGSAPHAVVGRIENDRLVLDLRTVLPRQDRALVEAFTGSEVAAEPTNGPMQAAPIGEPAS